jgi:hypothetical protein
MKKIVLSIAFLSFAAFAFAQDPPKSKGTTKPAPATKAEPAPAPTATPAQKAEAKPAPQGGKAEVAPAPTKKGKKKPFKGTVNGKAQPAPKNPQKVNDQR